MDDDYEFMKEFEFAKFKIIRDEYPGNIYYIGCISLDWILIGNNNKTFKIPLYKLQELRQNKFIMCHIDIFDCCIYLVTRKPVSRETRRLLVGGILEDVLI